MTDDIIVNPASGERLRWHVRARDSGGALVRAEMWCGPGGGAPQAHVHRHSEERFEVLAGRLAVEVAGERRSVGAGDHVRVPAGTPHRWWVDGDAEAHFFVELDHPRGFEEQMETYFSLGRRGALGPRGRLPLLAGACLAQPYLEETHLAGAPFAVQRVLVAVLAAVARLTGHHRAVASARAEARVRLAT